MELGGGGGGVLELVLRLMVTDLNEQIVFGTSSARLSDRGDGRHSLTAGRMSGSFVGRRLCRIVFVHKEAAEKTSPPILFHPPCKTSNGCFMRRGSSAASFITPPAG